MSSKENDHLRDAEMRELLRTLPQAGPSAELDAAILNAAEQALRVEAMLDADPDARVGKSKVFRVLAAENAAMNGAANDAAIPQPAAPARPGFLSRWKVPLAFAASVLVTVNMIGPQWFTSSPEAFPEAALPQPQPPRPVEPLQQAEPAAIVASEAAAPAPADKSAARTATVRRRAQSDAVAAAAPAAEQVAAPVVAQVREQPMALMRPEITESAPGKPAPAPPPPPAPAMAKPQPMSAPRAIASAASGDAAKEPQAWLRQIERMLADDRQKEALDQWHRFRRAFPAQPVPAELSERIGALERDAAAGKE